MKELIFVSEDEDLTILIDTNIEGVGLIDIWTGLIGICNQKNEMMLLPGTAFWVISMDIRSADDLKGSSRPDINKFQLLLISKPSRQPSLLSL